MTFLESKAKRNCLRTSALEGASTLPAVLRGFSWEAASYRAKLVCFLWLRLQSFLLLLQTELTKLRFPLLKTNILAIRSSRDVEQGSKKEFTCTPSAQSQYHAIKYIKLYISSSVFACTIFSTKTGLQAFFLTSIRSFFIAFTLSRNFFSSQFT